MPEIRSVSGLSVWGWVITGQARWPKLPGIRLVQVCDLREDRRKRTSEALHVPATPDFSEMLGNPEIEAVMIMNETGRHAELALQALNAGKHVLLTKPMEMSLNSCDEMIALAKEKNLLAGAGPLPPSASFGTVAQGGA